MRHARFTYTAAAAVIVAASAVLYRVCVRWTRAPSSMCKSKDLDRKSESERAK